MIYIMVKFKIEIFNDNFKDEITICKDDQGKVIGNRFYQILDIEFTEDWISTKDKLPKLYQDVLIYWAEADQVVNAVLVRPDEYNGEEYYWKIYGIDEWIPLKHVTRWMPLPDKPKEG